MCSVEHLWYHFSFGYDAVNACVSLTVIIDDGIYVGIVNPCVLTMSEHRKIAAEM